MKVKGYAAMTFTTPLQPWEFNRREPGARDVLIDIDYCGICHSDIHMVHDYFDLDARGIHEVQAFPVVPGHEFVGHVLEVGDEVTAHGVGDRVGVGVLYSSCRSCGHCDEGRENYCPDVQFTYGGFEADGKTPTYGGHSTKIVVDEHFVLKVPDNLDPAAAAPLMCAGITAWSPFTHLGIGQGHKLAVLGLGGLGHIAVKLGVSLGAEVTVLSRSSSKEADARKLGAHDFVLMDREDALDAHQERFDFIYDSVSAEHDIVRPIRSLAYGGTLIMVGAAPDEPANPGYLKIDTLLLAAQRRNVHGSLIGGIPEAQSLLDHCGEHGIVCDVEVIRPDQINEAYRRTLAADVKYRFVIDCNQF